MPEGRSHLKREDRKFIEVSLRGGVSFAFMGRKLGVHESTISREIKRNMTIEKQPKGGIKSCENSWMCASQELCMAGCQNFCKECNKVDCTLLCPEFKRKICLKTQSKPYVCNGCTAVQYGFDCGYSRQFYDAELAQEKTERRLSLSRSGVDLTAEELQRMVDVVKPLLEKGQSLEHIWATHPGEFPVTSRTFYSYIEDGLLEIHNIDLPRKIRYKKRKRKNVEPSLNPIYDGRRYADFQLLSENERAKAVEMDCVESARGSKKVILTLLFRHCNFQGMFLLQDHTRVCVQQVLDDIEHEIGLAAFKEHLGLILTDHGHEFNNYKELEKSCTEKGEKRCSVYYCDPNRPDQKGACERNHVLIRLILPKKTSFEPLDKEAISLVCSHVNSYARPILDNMAPIDVATKELPEELLGLLGVTKVKPEEIVLKPSLLLRWIER